MKTIVICIVNLFIFAIGSFYNYLEEFFKDSRNLWISVFLVRELGVLQYLSGALGLSVNGAKISTISICPNSAAEQIGVNPILFRALG